MNDDGDKTLFVKPTNSKVISTWLLLKEFGFMPDAAAGMSDEMPGLSFDFGNLKLYAVCVMNLKFREVVMFTGVLTTRRTIAEVIFELPRMLASRELCGAWITWNLDNYVFQPLIEVP
jgi:hypothetical protein